MFFSRKLAGKVIASIGLAFAMVHPHLTVAQNAELLTPTSNSLEKMAEHDLSTLIESWATEMDQVFAETVIKSKDTSNALFSRLGIKDSNFTKYVNSIKGKDNPFKKLVPGRSVQAKLTPEGKVLSFRIFRQTDVLSSEVSFFEVSRSHAKSTFSHANKKSAFSVTSVAVGGTISTTLEKATLDANIPASVLEQIKDQLSTVIDLKKDLAKGDTFSVVYEHRQLDGADLGAGRLLALEFYNKGNPIEAYWFEDDGVSGYFDSNGQSQEQTFIRIPTEARVTSAFNQVRRHPVTGRLRPHWGVDLGAPTGTPIVAASDGVISIKRYQRRGYGYWLELDHGNGYQSVYAHMSKYAPGLDVGVKVKKGQVIGYVGRTGMATGPHLHYELKKDGKQVNPLTANLPTSEGVPAEALQQYQVAIAPVKRQLAMIGKMNLASLAHTTH